MLYVCGKARTSLACLLIVINSLFLAGCALQVRVPTQLASSTEAGSLSLNTLHSNRNTALYYFYSFTPYTPRRNTAEVTLADGRVGLISGDTEPGSSTVIEVYHPGGRYFEKLPNEVAEALTRATAQSSGNNAYVFGGFSTATYTGNHIVKVNFDTNAVSLLPATLSAVRDGGMISSLKLSDGRILVVGGMVAGSATNKIEIFNPTTELVSNQPNLPSGIASASLIQISSTQVLIVGGDDGGELNKTFLFNPSTGASIAVGNLNAPRIRPYLILKSNGDVIALGGRTSSAALTSIEIYNSTLQTWSTSTATLPHSYDMPGWATLTSSSSMLVGGCDTFGGICYREAFSVDHNTLTFTALASPNDDRDGGQLIASSDGTIAYMGGSDSSVSVYTRSVEYYNIASNTWSRENFRPVRKQGSNIHQASNGTLTFAHGYGDGAYKAELTQYNPNTNSWSTVTNITNFRGDTSQGTLPDGNMLVIGGGGWIAAVSNRIELFDSTAQTYTLAGTLPSVRTNLATVSFPDGEIFAISGQTNWATSTATTAMSRITVSAGVATVSARAAIGTARGIHGAAIIGANTFIAFGGLASGGGSFLSSSQIYDRGTNLWGAGPAMTVPRSHATTLVHSNGKVLAIGGYTTGYVRLNTIDIYDPVGNSWATAIGTLSTAKDRPSVVELPDGRVLIAGGNSGALSDIDIYNPTTNTISPAGFSLPFAGWYFGFNRLADNRMILEGQTAGGLDEPGAFQFMAANPPIAMSPRGGTAPYTLSLVSGTGTFISAQQRYIPKQNETAVFKVTDAVGDTSTLSVTIAN